MEILIGKTFIVYGPFSSTPCLMTPEGTSKEYSWKQPLYLEKQQNTSSKISAETAETTQHILNFAATVAALPQPPSILAPRLGGTAFLWRESMVYMWYVHPSDGIHWKSNGNSVIPFVEWYA